MGKFLPSEENYTRWVASMLLIVVLAGLYAVSSIRRRETVSDSPFRYISAPSERDYYYTLPPQPDSPRIARLKVLRSELLERRTTLLKDFLSNAKPVMENERQIKSVDREIELTAHEGWFRQL